MPRAPTWRAVTALALHVTPGASEPLPLLDKDVVAEAILNRVEALVRARP